EQTKRRLIWHWRVIRVHVRFHQSRNAPVWLQREKVLLAERFPGLQLRSVGLEIEVERAGIIQHVSDRLANAFVAAGQQMIEQSSSVMADRLGWRPVPQRNETADERLWSSRFHQFRWSAIEPYDDPPFPHRSNPDYDLGRHRLASSDRASRTASCWISLSAFLASVIC